MFAKFKYNKEQAIYTVAVIILLCISIISMIGYVYNHAEDEALEELHMETLQIKNDINLQMFSDRENLTTMANFASKLYTDGESFDLLFDSFERIGLIENIGILTPNNKFTTKIGTIDVSEYMNFEVEALKGEYISGRVKDITNLNREIIYSAVPVKAENKTVAMLYGAIEPVGFSKRYRDDVALLGAELYVVEGKNGNLVLDTKHYELGTITVLESAKFSRNYTYEALINDLSTSKNGFTAFTSASQGAAVYMHYAPLSFSDWQILMAKPEAEIFASARKTINFLYTIFALAVFLMLAYVVLVIYDTRRKANVTTFASQIRKSLLAVNTTIGSVYEALRDIQLFSRARSAFFVDTYGEDFCDIKEEFEEELLSGEEKAYFIRTLFGCISQRRKEGGVSVQIITLTANNKLREQMPEFYDFMEKHHISSVHYAGVVDNNNNASLVGVINPKNKLVDLLIKEIAVCCSMAIYSKKHLVKTEAMALTDSLTGVANRMAYKQDEKELIKFRPDFLACIYIDVNELHYFNTKYGHAAGDQMLIYIAEVLTEEFAGSRIYRMGGDEFLIFVKDMSPGLIEEKIVSVRQKVEEMKYHISIGVKYLDEGMDIEELLNGAEKEMYEDKSDYYQHKEAEKATKGNEIAGTDIKTIHTGIKDVDTCLSIMTMRYHGIYSVNLETDRATQIVAPSYYFGMSGEETCFSDMLKQYIFDIVKPEFHRSLLNFVNYDMVKRQIESGHIPKITYTKSDGTVVRMSVYPVDKEKVLWVFEYE